MTLDVGGTLFSRARNLETELGLRRVHLKFEGSNPTGTQKDRVARLCYDDAHTQGFSTITVATCGNFGASIAWACGHNGIRPAVFVPSDYHTPRIVEMERRGARIVRVPGDYEDAVAASREAAQQYGWYDANPGSDAAWAIAQRGYGRIAHEIFAELGRMPDSVAAPVSNGTTLAGIYAGFLELAHERGVKPPRMIAGSTKRGNPIIKSWKLGSKVCLDLKPEEIRESEINEPLVNWRSFDGQRALDAVYESGGFAADASDAALRRITQLTRSLEGINVLTASTASLLGLAAGARDGLLHDGLHVAILTGRHFEKHRRADKRPSSGPLTPPADA